MGDSPFCRACGARVEYHLTASGAKMAIDPEPHPEGHYYFGQGLRLAKGRRGLKPRMYRCHWDTCPKKGQAPRRAAQTEESLCYRCHKPGHFADVCEEERDDG